MCVNLYSIFSYFLLSSFCFIKISALAAIPLKSLNLDKIKIEGNTLSEKLISLKSQVEQLEESLLESLNTQQAAQNQMKKIQKLLILQKMEKSLGEKRMVELSKTIQELESRREELKERLKIQQEIIRKSLMAIEFSQRMDLDLSIHLLEKEKVEAPRRKVLSHLVDRGLREVESLKIDLEDAARLETKIEEEKVQLVYLFQDLNEKASVLELNQKLRQEIFHKKQAERKEQLKNYRQLKGAESQVEKLLTQFNTRKELDKTLEIEKKGFMDLKGKLPLPVVGKIVSTFGKTFDPHAGLHIFKKGIDITTEKNHVVKAIASGKVAYAGELPHYGKVIIIDHGSQFYSLLGHLGQISKKTNENVISGEGLGVTGDANSPLYFEIRSKNVAVNPLQWLAI